MIKKENPQKNKKVHTIESIMSLRVGSSLETMSPQKGASGRGPMAPTMSVLRPSGPKGTMSPPMGASGRGPVAPTMSAWPDLYFINLDRSTERLVSIQKVLVHSEIPYPGRVVRLRATEESTYPKSLRLPWETHDRHTTGVGIEYLLRHKLNACDYSQMSTRTPLYCAMSHIRCWIECVQRNTPIIVMEDDAFVNGDYDKQWMIKMSSLLKRNPDVSFVSFGNSSYIELGDTTEKI